jgi:hypothetical protein
MSTAAFNSEPAMELWNALHFTTATLERTSAVVQGFRWMIYDTVI